MLQPFNRQARFAICLIIAAVSAFESHAGAAIIDSINGSATPGGNLTNTVTFSQPGNDLGWYYTAPFSYNMTGISTNFSPSISTLVTPTITMQIQTERPVNGGSVLAQGTFSANSSRGGVGGISFSPISILAGQTYFIDLQNINGMGVDLGQWTNVGSTPEPSAGATLNLGAIYFDPTTSTSDFSGSFISGDYVTIAGVNVSGAEPILNFSGAAVPEPSSVAMLAAFGIVLAIYAWRRSVKQSRAFLHL